MYRFHAFVSVCFLGILLTSCGIGGANTNVTGRWEQDNNPINDGAYVIMTLSQSGNDVLGSAFAGANGGPVVGQIRGNSLSLTSTENGDVVLKVNATVNGDAMTGTALYTLFGGANPVEFSLQRVSQ